MTTNSMARLALGIALALTAAAWAAPTRADEPAKELTDEERGALEKQAKKLNDQASQQYQDAKYAAATELMEQSLKMYRRLYPTEKYPDGHPDLAQSLSNLGALLKGQGEYGKAELYYRDALEMRKKLYPAEKYPGGHRALAADLNNLDAILRARGEYGKAEPYCREALEMCKKLYPADKYPNGHPALAQSLNNLGVLLQKRGEFGKAEPYFRDALEMRKKLFPAEKYPGGHPVLVQSLNNLGVLMCDRGEYAKAEPYYRDALAMCQKLYSAEKYPAGHPALIQGLDNLGALLRLRGEYDKAEPYFRDALAMCQKLYPAEKYAAGHPILAASLDNLGGLLRLRDEYGKAEPYFRDALEMRKKLYPADKYPDGHPDLARSLNNLSVLLQARGEYGKAEPFCRDALEMRKKLYPAGKYPDGHPQVAQSLFNLGSVLKARGEYGKAANALAESASMYDRLTAAFAENGAEAEALNLAASRPGARSLFLEATRHTESTDPADQYPVLWPEKSALARGLQRRRRLLHAASDADEVTRTKVQTLLGVRQDLARLVLAPSRAGDADRAQLVQDLTDKKERLEKELAALLPASDRAALPYTDLAGRLPERTAFIDVYRYADWDAKTRKWADTHYAIFVLRKGRPIRRVELANGAAIDKDLAEWRNDVVKDLRSDAAGRLRKAVWEPIAAVLGEGVDAVYVCPDGPLSALPWSALPGERPGSVLLEDYAFAVTPGGPSLLDQLTDSAPAGRGPGVLLAVGGVRYDRAVPLGKPWPSLPATEKERAAVVAEAGKLPHPPEIVERSGAGADAPRLLADLPKARWAHLATHGFFAAPDSKEREHLFRPDDFLMGVGGERRGAAERNPLTLSGVVLAGANQPTGDDSGVLTGEAVAGLDLDGMDLVVLSACQTGLGEAASGEGVFGLQRAFHIGGAKNVVASLWKVNDEATAALMNLFYYHLWQKNESPLQALHHAQLELFHHPRDLSALAKRGAIDFDETVQQVTKVPTTAEAKETAPAQYWAAFVLSGAGR